MGIGPVSSSTVICNLRRYTKVMQQRVLRQKTGSRDKESDWAFAQVARVKMTQEMLKNGEEMDKGTLKMEDCHARESSIARW